MAPCLCVEPIVGSTYVDLLRRHDPTLVWGENDKEYQFTYYDNNKKMCTVNYPTLHFLQVRLQLAHEHSIGVAVWELGQG